MWFIVGIYLFQSKVICIGSIWNYWLGHWIGDERFNELNLLQPDSHIDFAILNESLFSEFLFETFPQLLLQIINTSLVGGTNFAFIFSVALSGYNTLNGIYKYGYYVIYKQKSLRDVPQEIELLGGFFKSKHKQVVPGTEDEPEAKLEAEAEAWKILIETGHADIVEMLFVHKNLKTPQDLKEAEIEILEEILNKYKDLKSKRNIII
jgi:hypothetical protein